jgi:large subunit ribosomal protein L25
MEEVKLVAKKRDLQGSAHARRLRKAGSLPGVIYGAGEEAVSVVFDMHDFELMLHHHTSETMIVDVELEGEGLISALVKDVQHHPVTGELVHADLQKMDAKTAIHVEIQVNPVGEAEGVKMGGSLDQVLHTVNIECLPGALVEEIEVDVSDLSIGDVLHLSDLKLDKSLKLLDDPEAVLFSISGPRSEEEDEEASEAVAGEPEVITEKKVED